MANIMVLLGAFGWALIVTLCLQGVIVNITAMYSVQFSSDEISLDNKQWLRLGVSIYTQVVLGKLIYMVLYP